MRIYATPADLQEWLQDDAPADAVQRLRSASIQVSRWTSLATFEVDHADEPMPISSRIRNALRDATCAQAAWGMETGDVSGAGDLLTNISLGSFSSSKGGTNQSQQRDPRVSEEAVDILTQAGLLLTGPGSSW